MLELCDENHVSLKPEESTLLHTTIDEMMRTSASEFERASVSAYDTAMGVIAHDLRNPLNTIALHAEGLKSGQPIEEPAKAGEMLARNVRIMERLVEDLLAYSKIETGQFSVYPVDIDVCALARAVCENYQPLAHRRKIALTVSVPATAVRAIGDGDRLIQALGNLVGNALKFTPAGGAVRIELEARVDRCLLSVSDTGPGVAPEHAENVFRPFWQAPGTASKGAGLGLAIARAIIEAHGGALGLESHPPPGATFVLTLPYQGTPSPSVSLPAP